MKKVILLVTVVSLAILTYSLIQKSKSPTPAEPSGSPDSAVPSGSATPSGTSPELLPSPPTTSTSTIPSESASVAAQNPWLEGAIDLRAEHVRVVDSFIEALEERNPETLGRFFSAELKQRKSIAGHGNLKSFILNSLFGDGFFGAITNPESRKVKSVRENAFVLSVTFLVSGANDDEEVPLTLKFQFEKPQGGFVITQIAEKRG